MAPGFAAGFAAGIIFTAALLTVVSFVGLLILSWEMS